MHGRDSYVMKSDCIPQFSLDDLTIIAQCWVDKLDQLATINQWTEKTTIYHMQSRLAGLAKTWYYHLTDYNYSWEQWKALIVKTFPNQSDFASKLRALVNRTKLKDETWTQYYFGKLGLARACEVNDINSVSN